MSTPSHLLSGTTPNGNSRQKTNLYFLQFPAILLPRSEQMPIWHNSYYRVLHSNHLFQASRSKHFHLVTVFLLRVMSILTLNRIFMSISDLHGPINTFDKIWLLGLQISKSCLGIHQQSLRRLLCLVVFLFADHYSLKIVSTNFSVTEIVFCCEFCNANYFLWKHGCTNLKTACGQNEPKGHVQTLYSNDFLSIILRADQGKAPTSLSKSW